MSDNKEGSVPPPPPPPPPEEERKRKMEEVVAHASEVAPPSAKKEKATTTSNDAGVDKEEKTDDATTPANDVAHPPPILEMDSVLVPKPSPLLNRDISALSTFTLDFCGTSSSYEYSTTTNNRSSSGGAGGTTVEEEEEEDSGFVLVVPPPPPPAKQQIRRSRRSISTGGISTQAATADSEDFPLMKFGDIMKAELKRGVSGSTLLSDFTIFTKDGTKLRKCNTCSYLNPDGTLICQGCEAALIDKSPILQDMDAQIARHLQLQEEHFVSLQTAEQIQAQEHNKLSTGKKMSQETLLVQSQFLTQQILNTINDIPEAIGRYIPLSDVDLTLLVSRFIQAYKEDFRQSYHPTTKGDNETVLSFDTSQINISYTFTNKSLFQPIRINGFPNQTKVCYDIDAALQLLDGLPTTATTAAATTATTTVNATTRSVAEQERIGWIVATVVGDSNSDGYIDNTLRDIKIKGKLMPPVKIRTIERSSQILPLVCFDPCLRNQPSLATTKQNLTTCLEDFFDGF